jgi:hypothetical protein
MTPVLEVLDGDVVARAFEVVMALVMAKLVAALVAGEFCCWVLMARLEAIDLVPAPNGLVPAAAAFVPGTAEVVPAAAGVVPPAIGVVPGDGGRNEDGSTGPMSPDGSGGGFAAGVELCCCTTNEELVIGLVLATEKDDWIGSEGPCEEGMLIGVVTATNWVVLNTWLWDGWSDTSSDVVLLVLEEEPSPKVISGEYGLLTRTAACAKGLVPRWIGPMSDFSVQGATETS